MLWWLAQNTVGAAVLAVLVALICGVARPRPAVRHALWLVVLAKLLSPPLVSWPWTAWDIGQPVLQWLAPDRLPIALTNAPDQSTDACVDIDAPQAEAEIIFIPVNPQEEWPTLTMELPPANTLIENPGLENLDERAEQLPNVQDTPSISIVTLATKLWLIGGLGVGLWQGWRIGRFHRRLSKMLPTPDWLAGEVAELAARLQVRKPRIAVLSGIASPLVWSLGIPILVWPAELSKVLTETSRRSVLLHELAHLRRRDHWVAWLQLVGSCLYWWNPLFWFVSRQVRANAELACDAWVVTTLPETRRAFAEALIEVAQFTSSKRAPVPALGLGAGRRRDFERRLLMIMSAGVPCKLSWRGLVVVGLLAMTALPGWSPGQQGTEKPQPAPPVAVPPLPSATPAPPLPAVAAPSGEAAPTAVEPPENAQATARSDAQNGPEDRLKAIEDQLQALLKEVRGMRKGGTRPPTPATTVRPSASAGFQYVPTPAPTITAVPPTAPAPGQVVFPPPRWDGGTISLTRASYDLPAAKAKALADLLQDSKGPTVEIKAEGDKVTVTTTPEAQQVIAHLIAMLQGKARVYVPRTTYQYHAVPVTTSETVPATPTP
jgi:beta-lactamase regulating signal transducer with metallopeptidase domain